MPQPTKPIMQIVELHFRQKPICDYAAVKARAQEILESDLDYRETSGTNSGILIAHKNYIAKYTDGQGPALTAIAPTDQPPKLDAYKQDIQQSWRCPGAEDLLRDCTDTCLVAEMMARLLSPKDRISLFHGVLRAMV